MYKYLRKTSKVDIEKHSDGVCVFFSSLKASKNQTLADTLAFEMKSVDLTLTKMPFSVKLLSLCECVGWAD